VVVVVVVGAGMAALVWLARGKGRKLVLALPLCGDGSGLADRGGGAGRGCVCRLLGDLMHAGMRFPTGACTTATAPAPELWTKKGRNDRCSVYNVVVCDRGSLFVGKNKSRHLLCG
jgi:hypothetical protein